MLRDGLNFISLGNWIIDTWPGKVLLGSTAAVTGAVTDKISDSPFMAASIAFFTLATGVLWKIVARFIDFTEKERERSQKAVDRDRSEARISQERQADHFNQVLKDVTDGFQKTLLNIGEDCHAEARARQREIERREGEILAELTRARQAIENRKGESL